LTNHSGTQSDEQRPAGAVPRVLIVDDVADTRDLYAFYLRHKGIDVKTASDGLEGMVKALELIPDIIIMDLMMPGLTGIEATLRLKGQRATCAVRIIVLTASHDAQMRCAALDAGCDGFLTKPCSPEKVVAEIQRVLGRY
jgi:two-component system cell cycle response regulator DivK